MMMSPEMYIEEFKNKSYSELLVERNNLIKDITDYEEGNKKDDFFKPSGKTMYKMHLQYLAELCKLISSKDI